MTGIEAGLLDATGAVVNADGPGRTRRYTRFGEPSKNIAAETPPPMDAAQAYWPFSPAGAKIGNSAFRPRLAR
jgi:hypothetical protein